MNTSLPFERGLTLSQGLSVANPTGGSLISVLPTATGLWGQATPYQPSMARYRTPWIKTATVCGDPYVGYGNGWIKLMAVQAAATITVARKLVTFSTTAGLFGAVTTDPAIPSSGTAGLCALAIDHAYPVGKVIAKYDWFWCICGGLATLLVGTTTVAQGACMADANGLVAPCTVGKAVIGTADQAVTATGSATAYVWMRELDNQVSDAA